MRKRCSGASEWRTNYFDRGITVCERWMKFENFLADMGECPNGLTLDRINNDEGYEPGNCRWASIVEQCNNKRTNRIITVDGVSLTVTEWSRRTGISNSAISQRLRLGWSERDAVLSPLRRR